MKSLEEVHTIQIGSRHTTIPHVYTNYNNENNLKYNGTLMHTGHIDVTKRKTTPTREHFCAHNHIEHPNTTTHIAVQIPLAGLTFLCVQTTL